MNIHGILLIFRFTVPPDLHAWHSSALHSPQALITISSPYHHDPITSSKLPTCHASKWRGVPLAVPITSTQCSGCKLQPGVASSWPKISCFPKWIKGPRKKLEDSSQKVTSNPSIQPFMQWWNVMSTYHSSVVCMVIFLLLKFFLSASCKCSQNTIKLWHNACQSLAVIGCQSWNNCS